MQGRLLEWGRSLNINKNTFEGGRLFPGGVLPEKFGRGVRPAS